MSLAGTDKLREHDRGQNTSGAHGSWEMGLLIRNGERASAGSGTDDESGHA